MNFGSDPGDLGQKLTKDFYCSFVYKLICTIGDFLYKNKYNLKILNPKISNNNPVQTFCYRFLWYISYILE